MSRNISRPALSVRGARKPFISTVTPMILSLSFAFTGCNFNGSGPIDVSLASDDEDRYHEKSFSWHNPSATPALVKTAARTTRFATPEALGEALRTLDDSLRDPAFRDSLWKPIDYACDELALALWNVYGTVSLGDSIVLDEALLKSRCTYIGGEGVPGGEALGKAGVSNAVHPAQETEHRVYPYKMIGRSWDNFDLVVYKSTGAETQFKKHRTKLFTTAWWDTDAALLGVRAYLLNCGVVGTGTSVRRACYFAGLRTASARYSGYVVQRDYSAGLQVISNHSQANGSSKYLKVSDAVIGLHSADHAGIRFRASSSSGLTDATVLASMPPLEYVTW